MSNGATADYDSELGVDTNASKILGCDGYTIAIFEKTFEDAKLKHRFWLIFKFCFCQFKRSKWNTI